MVADPAAPASLFDHHVLSGYRAVFVTQAEILQLLKPDKSSLHRRGHTFYHRLDLPGLVPVLVQKPYEQLLHGHLGDPVNIQFRQHSRYIV